MFTNCLVLKRNTEHIDDHLPKLPLQQDKVDSGDEKKLSDI